MLSAGNLPSCVAVLAILILLQDTSVRLNTSASLSQDVSVHSTPVKIEVCDEGTMGCIVGSLP